MYYPNENVKRYNEALMGKWYTTNIIECIEN